MSKVQGTPFRVGEIEDAIHEESRAVSRTDGADKPGADDASPPGTTPRRPRYDRCRYSCDDTQGLGERPGSALVPGLR